MEVSVHTMEYYTVIIKDGIVLFTAKQMEWESTVRKRRPNTK